MISFQEFVMVYTYFIHYNPNLLKNKIKVNILVY